MSALSLSVSKKKNNFPSESVPDLVEPIQAGAVVYSGRFAALARDDDILDPPVAIGLPTVVRKSH